MNDGGAFRITFVERIPKSLGAMFRQKRSPLLAHGIAYLLARCEIIVIDRRPHIEPRAARKHAALSAYFDIGETASRIFLKQRRGIRLTWLANIEPPVRNESFRLRQLACSDVHAFVNLHGIGRDYFPVHAACDFLGDIGFTRRSGPNNHDYGVRELQTAFDRAIQHRRPRPTDTR